MRGAAFLIFLSLFTKPASAGPWGQSDSEVFARAAMSSEQIDGADAWRADLYGEYGLSGKWTVIGKAEAVQFPGAREFDASEARVVAQRRLIDRGWLVVAAGGGVVYGAAIGGIDGCDTAGAEARTSVGTSGSLAERDWYASIDLSSRWHSDGCERQKQDFVFGMKSGKNSTVSPQLYLEQSNRGANSVAVQIEWIEHYKYFDFTVAQKFERGELFEQYATIIAVSKKF